MRLLGTKSLHCFPDWIWESLGKWFSPENDLSEDVNILEKTPRHFPVFYPRFLSADYGNKLRDRWKKLLSNENPKIDYRYLFALMARSLLL